MCSFSHARSISKRVSKIDIALDPFPYNGHTTSLDAFWMGVPVPSRVGQTAPGRGGLSQLTNLGLADLAANTDDGYVTKVTELARDMRKLATLRRELRTRMERSPLMDKVRFARDMETAFRSMRPAAGGNQGLPAVQARLT